jgi:hypothetical protein
VHDVFAAVMRDPRQVGHVGGVGDTLSGPTTGVDRCDTIGRIIACQWVGIECQPMRQSSPFIQRHDRWTLVLQDCLVGMDAHDEGFAQSTSLKHGASMA